MKTICSAVLLCVLGNAAFAGASIQGLNEFTLTDCGPHGYYTFPNQRGPVEPRVLTPDAAPWLHDRAWDVRPFEPCKKSVHTPHKEQPKKHTVRPHPKASIPLK